MNRKFTYFGITSILLLAVGPAHSQTAPAVNGAASAASKEEKLPTADDLSEKCAKSSGGKGAWAKLQTMVMTGSIDIPTFGVSGKIEVYSKRPNKVLRISNVMDGQFIRKEAFDGHAAWVSDPQTGLKAIEGPRLEQLKVEAAFDSDARLKELYPDMKVTGRTKVGDKDAYVAVAHEPGGKNITMYLDAQTGLRLAEDSEGPDETGTVVKTNVVLEDYHAEGDVQLPHRIRISAPNVNLTIKIEEVKFNTPVDDAKFAMPAAAN